MTKTRLVNLDSRETGINPMLARMTGFGGDYAISAGTTPTAGLTFTHILITADATITDIKVGGVSVKAERHYTGTLPQGYLICAGGLDSADQINYVLLATGSAEGIVFEV
jgi:hypothetical protein